MEHNEEKGGNEIKMYLTQNSANISSKLLLAHNNYIACFIQVYTDEAHSLVLNYLIAKTLVVSCHFSKIENKIR